MKLTKFIKIRKWHFLLLFVICFMTILPLNWAEAGLGTIIINAARGIILAITITFLLTLASISLLGLKLSEVILVWASNPEILGNVTDSEFVMTAWETLRDFSNMFILLILVVIGISTALRIKEYEIKKTIPRLIGVAILINFSPVICGMVIDTANIFINFFLTAGGAGFNNTISLSSTIGSQFKNSLSHAFGNWIELVNGVLFLRLLAVIIFNLVAQFVFQLFAILFLVRNIALWILVILSPLAFLSYILPATKKAIFDKWRKELIQWSFIGVTGAFFIYLTQLMLSIETSLMLKNAPPTEATGFGSAELSQLVVMSIPILFLLIGFLVTISTSAEGAKQIIKLGKKGAGLINPTTKKGRENINRLRGRLRQATGPGVEKTLKKVKAYKPGWGQDEEKGTKAGRWMKRRAADGVGILTGMATAPGRFAVGSMFGSGEEGRKESDKAYKEAKGRDRLTNLGKLKNATSEQKAGLLRAMGEDKDIKQSMEEGVLRTSDITEAFKYASATGDKKTMKEMNLAVAHEEPVMTKFGKIIEKQAGRDEENELIKPGGLSKEDIAKGYKTYQDKVLRELRKAEDFEKLQMTNELQKKLGKVGIYYDNQQLAQVAKTLGRGATDKIQVEAENIVRDKGLSWFYEIDEDTGRARASNIPRYFASNAGTEVGYSSLPGARERKDMEGFETASRNWETGLRMSNKREEIDNLMKEINEAEKEEVDGEIRKIATSAKTAAEVKFHRRVEGKSKEEMTEEEFKKFVHEGKVSQERIDLIARRIRKGKKLTDKERDIHANKGNEINAAINKFDEEERRKEGGPGTEERGGRAKEDTERRRKRKEPGEEER